MTTELSLSKQVDFNADQVQVIKATICKNATDTELAFFLNVCKSRNLNPFAHQIHSIERKTKDEDGNWITTRVIQTGIGGFRSISESTGKFAGETKVQWFDKEGKAYDLWTKDENPFAASAGVLKIIGNENGKPITTEIRESVYWDAVVQKKRDQTPTRMWLGKSGVQQLAKCAKAAAHRAGFGEVLGGIYSHEEMEHLAPAEIDAVQTKHEETKDFVGSLPDETVVRMDANGFNNEAKRRVLCNEALNTVEGLTLHLDALDYAKSIPDELKNMVRGAGYKNQMEVRRFLVDLKRENWNETQIKKFLNGEPILEGGKP